MNLSAADVGLLLATIDAVREPQTLDLLRPNALRHIRELVCAESTSWNEIDPRSGAALVVTHPDVPIDDFLEPFNANLDEHPVIRHHSATGDGRPRAISDFLTQDDFHRSNLYLHVYRPLGVEDQMSFVLPDPDILVGLACNGQWHAFSERDRSLLNLLRPHLVGARRHAIAYERTQWYLSTIDDLLEREGEGLLLIDKHGHAEYLTPHAAQISERWFGMDSPGALPTALADWLARGADGEALALETTSRRLRAHRLPGPDDASVAVLLRESGLNPTSQARLTALGLTVREAEILQLAVDGLANAQIATQLGISRRTVEQHVHAALSKLGATNRTQAARLLRER